jgi:hypothetical protein
VIGLSAVPLLAAVMPPSQLQPRARRITSPAANVLLLTGPRVLHAELSLVPLLRSEPAAQST